MSTSHTSNAGAADVYYPKSLFKGPFAPTSSEYIAACRVVTRAGIDPRTPWIACNTRLVVFYTKCSSSTPYAFFELNCPISVLAMVDNAFVHAFYGMVRAINVWSDNDPREVKYTVTVEVHVAPNVDYNWSNMVPWPGVLKYVPFLHPHAFLTADYCPMSLADTPTDEMSIVHYEADQLDDMIALACRNFAPLSSLEKFERRLDNAEPQPPVILLASLRLEHGEFISMIVTPPDSTTSPQSPTSPYPRQAGEPLGDVILNEQWMGAFADDVDFGHLWEPWSQTPPPT